MSIPIRHGWAEADEDEQSWPAHKARRDVRQHAQTEPVERNRQNDNEVELANFRISNALFAAVLDASPTDTPDVLAQALDELGQADGRDFARILGRDDPTWLDASAATPAMHRVQKPGAAEEARAWAWDSPDLSLLPDDHPPTLEFPVEIFGAFWAEWRRVWPTRC